MAAAGVVALELIVDMGRGVQLLLQAVGPHQGRGPVHFVEIADLLGDGDQGRVVVQLLLHQFPAEHGAEFVGAQGLTGARVQQRGGLRFHIRAEIVPGLRQLILGKIDFVRDLVVFHGLLLLSFGCDFFVCCSQSRHRLPGTYMSGPPEFEKDFEISVMCHTDTR